MAHDRGVLGREHEPGRELLEADETLREPVGIGMFSRQRGFDLLVLDDAPRRGVDEEHLAGLQAPLFHDRGRVDVQHAHLGGEHDEAIVGDPVAGGAKPVAVKDRAHDRPVGESEGPPGRVHLGVVLPGLGDHHEHGVGDGAPGQVQQLEDLVEGGRVARPRGHDGEDPLDVALEAVARQERLPGAHPVPVALQGVDLAVMGDEAVRMGKRPRREGIGREPRVHERDPALCSLVGEIGEEPAQLLGGEHALVDDRAGRKRREVHTRAGVLDALSHDEAPAFEVVATDGAAGAERGCGFHEDLGKARGARLRPLAARKEVDRDLAPAEHAQALLGRDVREQGHGHLGGAGSGR